MVKHALGLSLFLILQSLGLRRTDVPQSHCDKQSCSCHHASLTTMNEKPSETMSQSKRFLPHIASPKHFIVAMGKL